MPSITTWSCRPSTSRSATSSARCWRAPASRYTPSAGTYFQLADYSAVSALPDVEFARWLTREVGVAAIPVSVFSTHSEPMRVVRFCFAKSEATLDAAGDRLRRLGFMNTHLRVTLVQSEIAWEAPAANRHRLAEHFRGLAGHTDLIVLPEMFSTGFSMDAATLAESMNGPTVGWMREEAAAMGCVITGSLIVREAGPSFQPPRVGPSGRVARTLRQAAPVPHGRRAHALRRRADRASRSSSRAGASVRSSATTCAFRSGAATAATTTCCSTSRTGRQRRAHAWAALLRARAIENLCYVAA